MMPTITVVRPFYPKFIREFIVNLPAKLDDYGSPKYQKVHVRGKCFEISPALINKFLQHSLLVDYSVNLPLPEQLALELSRGASSQNATHLNIPTSGLHLPSELASRL
ncbi:flocculation protein FLO11-like [Cucumis melo var. makuwa]|uniref:Flocculation protein FLO11-like n=1 Tax=Cucumis melo var. makuwa TaxID=1194695 RepID=A0A5A7UFC9_CUCMM|nr:flocculation protein FLO11-like [Cucumis melo var. makuwa]